MGRQISALPRKLSSSRFRSVCLGTLLSFAYVNVVYPAVEPVSAFWKNRRAAAENSGLKKAEGSDAPARVSAPERENTLLAQLPSIDLNVLSHTLPQQNILPQNLGMDKWNSLPERPQSPLDEIPSSKVPGWFKSVPSQYANLKEMYFPSGWKPGDLMVVHIQDAHANVEAQANIAKIIESIAAGRKDLKPAPFVVGLEGARGEFNFAPYRSFPDSRTARDAAEYFLKEGFITGPEYTGMTLGLEESDAVNLVAEGKDDAAERFYESSDKKSREPPLHFWGLETEDHYVSHVRAFKDSVRFQKEAESELKRLSSDMDRIKRSRLHLELRELDQKMSQYRKSEIGLGAYLKYLTRNAGGNGAGAAIAQFMDALALEESMNYRQVEIQRKNLTRELARNLPPAELKNLVNASLSYRMGNVTHAAFYRYLRQICGAYGMSFDGRSEMEKYIRYVLISDKIQPEQLFGELERLEQKLLSLRIRSAEERSVIALSRDLSLIEKLVRFGLTPQEWEEYRSRSGDIRNVEERIARLAGGAAMASKPDADFARLLESFERFNRAAIQRNESLVGNLLAQVRSLPQAPAGIKAGGDSLAILVAGGFHTQGMMDLLKEKKIAYAVLMPRLGKVEGTGAEYLDAFTRDKTPIEKLFTGDRITLASPLVTTGGWMQGSLSSAQESFGRIHFVVAAGTLLFNISRRVNQMTGAQKKRFESLIGAWFRANRFANIRSWSLASEESRDGALLKLLKIKIVFNRIISVGLSVMNRSDAPAGAEGEAQLNEEDTAVSKGRVGDASIEFRESNVNFMTRWLSAAANQMDQGVKLVKRAFSGSAGPSSSGEDAASPSPKISSGEVGSTPSLVGRALQLGLDEESVLRSLGAWLVRSLTQTLEYPMNPIDVENLPVRDIGPEDLPYPDGPNVGILPEGVPGLEGLVHMGASRSMGAGTNFLIVPPVGGLFFGKRNPKAVFAKSAVFMDRSGNLVLGRFREPIPIHALDHAGMRDSSAKAGLTASGVPLLNTNESVVLATDKAAFAKLLQRHGLPTPEVVTVSADQVPSDPAERENFMKGLRRKLLGIFSDGELVVKPNDLSGGKGVRMFPASDWNETAEYLSSAGSAGDSWLVQRRIVNHLWPNPSGNGYMDWNLRVLTTWKDGKVYVDENMIEVRYLPTTRRGVNKSLGARVIPLRDFYRVLGRESYPKIKELVERASEVLDDGIRAAGGASEHAGLIGWDLMMDSQRNWVIIEANTGSVGGVSTLEGLADADRKGSVVIPIGEHFAELALAYRDRYRDIVTDEQGEEIDFLDDPVNVQNFSLVFLQNGRYDVIEKLSRLGLDLNDRHDASWVNLGVALSEQGKPDEARAAWEAGLAKVPGSPEILLALAVHTRMQQEYGLSEGYYRQILEGDENNLNALKGLGRMLLSMRRYSDASAVLASAVQISEEDAEALFLLGVAHYHQNGWDSAEMYLSRAVKLDASNSEAADYLNRAQDAKSLMEELDRRHPAATMGWVLDWIINPGVAVLNRIVRAINRMAGAAIRIPLVPSMSYRFYRTGIAWWLENGIAYYITAVILNAALSYAAGGTLSLELNPISLAQPYLSGQRSFLDLSLWVWLGAFPALHLPNFRTDLAKPGRAPPMANLGVSIAVGSINAAALLAGSLLIGSQGNPGGIVLIAASAAIGVVVHLLSIRLASNAITRNASDLDGGRVVDARELLAGLDEKSREAKIVQLAEEMGRIHGQAFQHTYWQPEQNVRDWIDYWEMSFKHMDDDNPLILSLDKEGKVQGFISGTERSGGYDGNPVYQYRIGWMVVDPRLRQQGIGTRLRDAYFTLLPHKDRQVFTSAEGTSPGFNDRYAAGRINYSVRPFNMYVYDLGTFNRLTEAEIAEQTRYLNLVKKREAEVRRALKDLRPGSYETTIDGELVRFSIDGKRVTRIISEPSRFKMENYEPVDIEPALMYQFGAGLVQISESGEMVRQILSPNKIGKKPFVRPLTTGQEEIIDESSPGAVYAWTKLGIRNVTLVGVLETVLTAVFVFGVPLATMAILASLGLMPQAPPAELLQRSILLSPLTALLSVPLLRYAHSKFGVLVPGIEGPVFDAPFVNRATMVASSALAAVPVAIIAMLLGVPAIASILLGTAIGAILHGGLNQRSSTAVMPSSESGMTDSEPAQVRGQSVAPALRTWMVFGIDPLRALSKSREIIAADLHSPWFWLTLVISVGIALMMGGWFPLLISPVAALVKISGPRLASSIRPAQSGAPSRLGYWAGIAVNLILKPAFQARGIGTRALRLRVLGLTLAVFVPSHLLSAVAVLVLSALFTLEELHRYRLTEDDGRRVPLPVFALRLSLRFAGGVALSSVAWFAPDPWGMIASAVLLGGWYFARARIHPDGLGQSVAMAGMPGTVSEPPMGRIELDKPIHIDVRSMSVKLGKHLKIANGDEYILDESGTTILLFEGNTGNGFARIYSPRSRTELRRLLSSIGQQQDTLADLMNRLGLETGRAQAVRFLLSSLRSLLKPILGRPEQSAPPSKPAVIDAGLGLGDLPESHFLNLTEEEMRERKKAQWDAIKELPDSNIKKILYFRRFISEFHTSAQLTPELRVSLGQNNPFRFYAVDTSRFTELQQAQPYNTTLPIPEGSKVGIVVGYHHLEKPWGNLLKEMFARQVQYPSESIVFVDIENMAVPTGDFSSYSLQEIQRAIKQHGLTHIVDVHEQLSFGNHYMDFYKASEFNESFREGRQKNPAGEYTLDPFVPLWAIEQYYQGNIYPQLQHAVNEQIKKIETLIRNIGKTETMPPDSTSYKATWGITVAVAAVLNRLGWLGDRVLDRADPADEAELINLASARVAPWFEPAVALGIPLVLDLALRLFGIELDAPQRAVISLISHLSFWGLHAGGLYLPQQTGPPQRASLLSRAGLTLFIAGLAFHLPFYSVFILVPIFGSSFIQIALFAGLLSWSFRLAYTSHRAYNLDVLAGGLVGASLESIGQRLAQAEIRFQRFLIPLLALMSFPSALFRFDFVNQWSVEYVRSILESGDQSLSAHLTLMLFNHGIDFLVPVFLVSAFYWVITRGVSYSDEEARRITNIPWRIVGILALGYVGYFEGVEPLVFSSGERGGTFDIIDVAAGILGFLAVKWILGPFADALSRLVRSSGRAMERLGRSMRNLPLATMGVKPSADFRGLTEQSLELLPEEMANLDQRFGGKNITDKLELARAYNQRRLMALVADKDNNVARRSRSGTPAAPAMSAANWARIAGFETLDEMRMTLQDLRDNPDQRREIQDALNAMKNALVLGGQAEAQAGAIVSFDEVLAELQAAGSRLASPVRISRSEAQKVWRLGQTLGQRMVVFDLRDLSAADLEKAAKTYAERVLRASALQGEPDGLQVRMQVIVSLIVDGHSRNRLEEIRNGMLEEASKADARAGDKSELNRARMEQILARSGFDHEGLRVAAEPDQILSADRLYEGFIAALGKKDATVLTQMLTRNDDRLTVSGRYRRFVSVQKVHFDFPAIMKDFIEAKISQTLHEIALAVMQQ